MKLLLISVYAPQVRYSKRLLWNYLSSLIIRWKGECLVMGDFNEVRCIDERWGSTFNKQGVDLFNSFISSSGLIDIQMEGYSFTWAHPSASKMSVMVDGDWVVDPILVKKEFRDHFADRFQDPGPRKGRINFQFPNRLSSDHGSLIMVNGLMVL
ncbi:RNA-directed DNA polymerase, eukaryota [Tanacetum coccineum]